MAVLESSRLEYVSLVDPRTPQLRDSLNLDGDFKSMARIKDTVMVAGTAYGGGGASKGGSDCVAKLIALEPQPRAISHASLDPISTVLDSSAQRDHFVVLGEGGADRFVATLPFDKTRKIVREQVSPLPKKQGGGYGAKSSIVLNGKNAYVASGWTGVQILYNDGQNWQSMFEYTIPRLPASSIATWGNRAVLAGSDLKLYDIAEPDRPSLITTANLTAAVRSIVGAGSYVLCLAHDTISLRKMEQLETVIASAHVTGQQMCFDKVEQKAFVLNDQTKKTTVSKFKIFSNDIVNEKNFDLTGSFSRASAHGGYLAVCGLNDMTLYGLSEQADLIGTRHFENLGIRDLCLMDDFIVASAVDQKSKGFLLTLSKDQKDLRVLGSIELPHDGVALAAEKNRVVTIGRSADGKDAVTIVDISAPATPKILTTMGAVEAASAVAIKDKYAIVAGRGIEILSLA
jgi:hypothetical protein